MSEVLKCINNKKKGTSTANNTHELRSEIMVSFFFHSFIGLCVGGSVPRLWVHVAPFFFFFVQTTKKDKGKFVTYCVCDSL